MHALERSFEADGPVEAEVEVPAGIVEVEPSRASRATVRIEAMRCSRRAEELLEATEVSYATGTLRVQVPGRPMRNVEVRCTLGLPEGSRLSTKTASADVRCSVRLAAFEGTTASGDAVLGDVDGDVVHKSASGDLVCAQAGGRLEVRTASGDVSVQHAAGDVEVALASGDVHVAEAAASVSVRSASGDVRLDRVRSGRVQAQSASGDVTIGVAEGVGAYLDVTTVSGETRCTLPFHEDAPGAGAGLEIVARTVSGDVVVTGAPR